MMSVLIMVLSAGALVEFFLSYCRSTLLAYRKVGLSEKVRDVTGLAGPEIAGTEFRRLLGLVRVSPDPGDDALEIRAVSIYYTALALVRDLTAPFLPPLRRWTERERANCAHFAAVTLDRRLGCRTQ